MNHLFPIEHSYLIPLLPLLGAVISGFFGAKWLKGKSHWPIWLGVGASAVLAGWLMAGMIQHAHAEHHGAIWLNQNWYNWISAGNFSANVGFLFDPLTAVMLCVVCGIGFLITVYAAGYMKGEEGYFRFFAYLGLFIFMMTMLVMGNNFLMMYLGWEGVGLSSYLLIGYYYQRPAAREAAKKAFLVNRIGDFGFGLGILLIFLAFNTVGFFDGGRGDLGVLRLAASNLADLSAFQVEALKWIPFLLMLGAFGKSAQFPLYVWLPDAMEGPTPVSALIHAATMVTAGVYMIARCGTLFVGNTAAMWTIALVGAFTALFAATIALRQFDLKKVFAYSTVSQLGFMFVGVGVLAPVAGVFHLVTHAFFKALLFLSSGVVMHAMLGELDMRKMSGLKRVLPITRWLMLIGCLALAGFPFFSGFFSKDEIVAAAWARHSLLGLVMLFTAFLTAYYTFRLYFRVFEGPLVQPQAPVPGHGAHDTPAAHSTDMAPDAHGANSARDAAAAHDAHGAHGGHDSHHSHEPALMILPLIVLALGALLAGYLNWPEYHGRSWSLGEFLGQSPSLRLAHTTAVARLGAGEIAPVPFGQPEITDARVVMQQQAFHLRMMIISGLVSALGIYLAYLMHLKDRAASEKLARRFAGVARLLEGKYWVDEIYQNGIVEPLRRLAKAFYAVDRYVVDGVVWLIGFVPQLAGFSIKLVSQRGYLQGYATWMLFGVLVILLLVLW